MLWIKVISIYLRISVLSIDNIQTPHLKIALTMELRVVLSTLDSMYIYWWFWYLSTITFVSCNLLKEDNHCRSLLSRSWQEKYAHITLLYPTRCQSSAWQLQAPLQLTLGIELSSSDILLHLNQSSYYLNVVISTEHFLNNNGSFRWVKWEIIRMNKEFDFVVKSSLRS